MLLVIGLILFTAANLGWAHRNWVEHKDLDIWHKALSQAESALDHKIEDAFKQVYSLRDEVLAQAKKDAATFSVCKTCGRIVQGACDICKG